MAYGDEWEREITDSVRVWWDARTRRELEERGLHPNERLDEVGWGIFYCAITRGMEYGEAARLAMNGNYRVRCLVRDDMWRRDTLALRKRHAELNPGLADVNVWDTRAPEQLQFWHARLKAPEYVYFIQSDEDGPVKIGLSKRPERRLPQLQTGNHKRLHLRHIVPGDLSVEQRLHRRFEPARLRGEWFGKQYLPIILAFAAGLADEMIGAYDGSGSPPRLAGASVRSEKEVLRMQRDIERLWAAGFRSVKEIEYYTWIDEEEIEDQLIVMARSTVWDIPSVVAEEIEQNRRWRGYEW